MIDLAAMSPSRRSSSVYSRDMEGNEYAGAHTQKASQTASQGDLFLPFSHFVGPSPQDAHQDDRSWGKVNGLVSACHLLVWADGFQFHIMHAVKLMQEEIRPLYRERPTSQRAETLEVKCQDLNTVLASWSRHNQLLSQGVSPAALKALPDLSTVDVRHLSQAAAEYQEKIHCLPTSKACEANLDVVYRLRAYFVEDVECVSGPAAADDNSLSVAPMRRIRDSTSAVHKHLDDVLFSAERVLNDVTTAWKHFSRMSDKIAQTATAAAKQNEEEQAVESPGRRVRALRHVKSLFSGTRSYHNTVRLEDGHSRLRKKSTSKPEDTRIISGPSDARHVQGLSGPRARSLLTVLAPARLSDLVQRQIEIHRHFARFEPLCLPDEHSEPPENHKSVLRADDDNSLDVQGDTCARRLSLDDKDEHPYHEGPSKASCHASMSSKNVQPEPDDFDRHRSNRSPSMVIDRDETVLTSLEQEVLEACAAGAILDQPSDDEDPEVVKAWWRNRALQTLEGGPSYEEEPKLDNCGARVEEAEEETEENTEETEEKAKARRDRDVARALAFLEGRETVDEDVPSQEEWLEQQRCQEERLEKQRGMEHWTLD